MNNPSTLALLFAAVAGFATLTWAPESAEACSVACPPGATTPDAGATFPSNLRKIYWRTYQPRNIQKSDIQLSFRTSPGGPTKLVPFQLHRLTRPNMLAIEPTNGFRSGVTYHLVGNNCSRQGIDLRFDTGTQKPAPRALGNLTLDSQTIDQLEVEHGAACSQRISAAQAHISVALSSLAKPWKDVLRYQTFVDGKAWDARKSVAQTPAPGASWQGRGEDILYAYCGSGRPPSSALAQGAHTVHMKAYLETAGGTKTYQTNKVQVVLTCGNAEPAPDLDAGPDIGPDVGPTPDTTPVVDAAPDVSPSVDSGPDTVGSTDTAADAAPETDATTPAEDALSWEDSGPSGGANRDASVSGGGGCTCSSRRGGPAGSLVVLALASLFALRRRRTI